MIASQPGRLGIAAGEGLGATSRLIRDVLGPVLNLPTELEDGYRFSSPTSELVITSDIFSVNPLEFPGGDIGEMAASGVINDLLASGARIRYASLGVYASADLDELDLVRYLSNFARLLKGAGAQVLCGDTKVHTDRTPALLLSVTAIGEPLSQRSYSLADTLPSDDIFVSGHLGDHSIAVLSAREGLGFESIVRSDVRPLVEPIEELIRQDMVHSLRDLTRGGLVAALWDGYNATGLEWSVSAPALPISTPTRAAAEMLGLDVLTLTNEGCMLITSPPEMRDEVLATLSRFDATADARLVGSVGDTSDVGPLLRDPAEPTRLLNLPSGIGVPRLC